MTAPFRETDIQTIYQQRFKNQGEYRNLVWKLICQYIFQPMISEKATVLDLGFGYGEFLRNIQCAIKIGMDLNPDTQKQADYDWKVILQDCSDQWKLPTASIDVIFTSNFFEHLPSKVELAKTLQQAYLHLKPGGTLIAVGPNIAHINGKYWKFWDHHIPLTGEALAEGMQTYGFQINRIEGKFLPYTMQGQVQLPAWVIRTYLTNRSLWKIFGKQFLIVARKP